MNAEGKYDFSNASYSLNGDRGGVPDAMYYLVRKDVADGVELAVPDISSELSGSSVQISSVPNVRSIYTRAR